MAQLRILYNSVCPVCRKGICYFERRTPVGPSGVIYDDVSASPSDWAARGIELNDVRRKLHAVMPDGQIVKGWPAVAALWQETPGYGWLARLGSLPVLNWGARAGYATAAQFLWWWNRASGRW